MKIDTSIKLKTLDGRVIKNRVEDGKDKKGKILFKERELTLGEVCTTSLLGNYEEKIDGTEKARRYKMAMDIYSTTEDIILPSEDITLLKKLISQAFSTLVSGQAWEFLDPSQKPKLTIPKKD